MDGNGNVVVNTSGYRPPKDFMALLNRVLDLKHIPDWEATLKTDPTNIDALSNLGTSYALKNDEANAVMYAKAAMPLKATTDEDKAKLADLFNGVGDLFQNGNKFDDAVTYFEAAANSGASTDKIVYALTSEAICYLSTNKGQQALDVCKRAEALPGVSADDAKMIASLKAAATKMAGGKAGG